MRADAGTAATRRRSAPVAPVRYPVDLTSCLRALCGGSRRALPGVLTGSGEEALVLALACMKQQAELASGVSVVVPDFICSSVPRAVERAGLVPRFASLDPERWTYRRGALEEALDEGARAFVAVSYFGLPAVGEQEERERFEAAARRAVAIEDLAQAYGLTAEGRLPGARFAIYSFGRGKSLALAWGGLVEALGEPERRILAERARGVPRGGLAASLLDLALAELQSLVLHPLVWRFVPLPKHHLVDAGAARTRSAPGWPIDAYLNAAASRLARVIAERRANALRMHAQLAACAGIGLPSASALASGVALRLPVLFDSAVAAEEARTQLERRGIVKGPNSWEDYARPSTNASSIAARLVTLPTHPGSEAAAERAVDLVLELA